MFIIDNNITKDDVLGYLSAQLRSGQPAVIFLYELPSYLSSKIAFEKFLKSVSKYPRPITWQTQDESIAEIITQTHKMKPAKTQELSQMQRDAVLSIQDKIQEHIQEHKNITVTVKNYLFVLPTPGLPDLFYPDEELKRWENSIKKAKRVFTKEWFRDQLNKGSEIKTRKDGNKSLLIMLLFLALVLIVILITTFISTKQKKLAFVETENIQLVTYKNIVDNYVLASGPEYKDGDFSQGSIEIKKLSGDANFAKSNSGKNYTLEDINASLKIGDIVKIKSLDRGVGSNLKINETVDLFDSSGVNTGLAEVVEDIRLKNNLKEVTPFDLENLKGKNDSLNKVKVEQDLEQLKKKLL